MKALVRALSILVLVLVLALAAVSWALIHAPAARPGKPETLDYPATGEGCPPGYVAIVHYGSNGIGLCFEDRQKCSYCVRQDLAPRSVGPTYLPAAL